MMVRDHVLLANIALFGFNVTHNLLLVLGVVSSLLFSL